MNFDIGGSVCVFILDETLTVDHAGLMRSLNLAKAMSCEHLNCINASRWGKVVCNRCQLVNELTTLSKGAG